VNERIVGNLLKYALALGLMIYVVWSNWGHPQGTVGKIVVGGEPPKDKITGKVVAYKLGESITIEELSRNGAEAGPKTEFALKKKGWMASLLASLFNVQSGETKVVQPGDVPLPEGESLREGTTVTL
jgi:hypothetical protein